MIRFAFSSTSEARLRRLLSFREQVSCRSRNIADFLFQSRLHFWLLTCTLPASIAPLDPADGPAQRALSRGAPFDSSLSLSLSLLHHRAPSCLLAYQLDPHPSAPVRNSPVSYIVPHVQQHHPALFSSFALPHPPPPQLQTHQQSRTLLY